MKKTNTLGAMLLILPILAYAQVMIDQPGYHGYAHQRNLEQAFGTSSGHRGDDSVSAASGYCVDTNNDVVFSGKALFRIHPLVHAQWWHSDGDSNSYCLNGTIGNRLVFQCFLVQKTDSLMHTIEGQQFFWPMLDSVSIGNKNVAYRHDSPRCDCGKKNKYQSGADAWIPEQEVYNLRISPDLIAVIHLDRDVSARALQKYFVTFLNPKP